MDPEAFITATLDWLRRRVLPPDVPVDADTPLFENGLVDSIRILKLIAWTETRIGRTIADREIRMDNFRSVRRIAAVFVGEGSS
jgi:acyl carrier protein